MGKWKDAFSSEAKEWSKAASSEAKGWKDAVTGRSSYTDHKISDKVTIRTKK